jgi:hypothetical protein
VRNLHNCEEAHAFANYVSIIETTTGKHDNFFVRKLHAEFDVVAVKIRMQAHLGKEEKPDV